MATPTYTLIDSVTLASTASSVTFSSIDQSYRDLVAIVQTTSDSVNANMRFNADSGSNYNRVYAYGDGSSSVSLGNVNGTALNLVGGALNNATSPLLLITQIFDYAQGDKHKPIIHRADNSANGTMMLAGRWASTSAITTVQWLSGANPFKAGSTFYLFGIAG